MSGRSRLLSDDIIEPDRSFEEASLLISIPRYLSDAENGLSEKIKHVQRKWVQHFCGLMTEWKNNPGKFNFEDYKLYFDALHETKEDSDENRRAIKEARLLFLRFVFYIAHDDLSSFASASGSGLATDALNIADEFRLEFNSGHFDEDMLLEKIELLWRVKQALSNPFDELNYEELGILAERSNSKFCWLFFLGLTVFLTSIAIIIATHGVAIPYLKALAELSVTGKTAVLTGGILGSEAGLGIMWWQRRDYPTSTAFCCFWHKMKKQREQQATPAKSNLELPSSSHK